MIGCLDFYLVFLLYTIFRIDILKIKSNEDIEVS